jgi:hypothetical protein
MGLVLVGVAALTVTFPEPASMLQIVVLLLAIAGDQIRLQPEIASLALICVLMAWRQIRIARVALASLWLWAGINKAFSKGWENEGATFIANALHLDSHKWIVTWGAPIVEFGLGCIAVFYYFAPPRFAKRRWFAATKWAVAVGGCLLHLGIFLTLSPLFARFNSAVWPWNLALAIISPIVFLMPLQQRQTSRERVAVGATSALLLLSPLGFYFGVVDAYLAHNLYSSNTTNAVSCRDGNCVPFPGVDPRLNVPLPPELRLLKAWFRRECTQGDQLVVTKPATRITGERTYNVNC